MVFSTTREREVVCGRRRRSRSSSCGVCPTCPATDWEGWLWSICNSVCCAPVARRKIGRGWIWPEPNEATSPNLFQGEKVFSFPNKAKVRKQILSLPMPIFTGCVNFYDTSWFGLPSQVCKSGAFTVMPDQLSAVEVTSVKAPPPYQACVHGMCMAYFTQTSTKYNPVLNYRIYSGVPDSSCFPLRVVALVIWTDCNNYF